MNALIACGGTGGHLFPGLAVAEALQARGDHVLVVISEKEIDTLAVANLKDSTTQPTVAIETLPGIGLPRFLSSQILPFGIQFLRALRRAKAFVTRFHPDIALGMGGFSCVAPILIARRLKVPTFLHESNAIPGKANRWIARWVDEVFVGFESCVDQFSPCATMTGTPVRAELQRVPRAAARLQLDLDPNRFTVLVIGGSQGAKELNDLLCATIPHLSTQRKNIQFVHLSGTEDVERMCQTYEATGFTACVRSFLHPMQLAYSAADLVISRAGAATLTELAWYSLPSLLLPYPFAAEQHQHRNAELFERAGAARLVLQETQRAKSLAEQLAQLRSNPQILGAMAESAARLKRANAVTKIIERLDARRRGELTTGIAHLSIA